MIDIIGTLRHVYRRVNQLFEFAAAQLRLTETGGVLTADGTAQTVIVMDPPMGSFKASKLKVSLSNMDWGDTVILRWFERLSDGGVWDLKDRMEFSGPQDVVPDSPEKNIELEPNRFGIWITLQQTAGTYRNFAWEWFYED